MARVVAIVPDLLFGSKVKELLEVGGHDVLVAATPDAERDAQADVVVVDLATGFIAPEDVAPGPRRLAFYGHTDQATRERADAAGYDLVVPRSRMNREGAELVTRLAAES